MTTVDRKCPNSRNNNADRDTLGIEALASVRADLLRLPAKAVRRPEANVAEVTAGVLALVRAKRPSATPEQEVRLARLELLARALDRAEHELMWEAPIRFVQNLDEKFAAAERKFLELDELVDTLARRREISRRDIPRLPLRDRRSSPRKNRCDHVLALTAFLAEHDGADSYTRGLAREAERLASHLGAAQPEVPGHISPTELRDRAYTELRSALGAGEASETPTEESGVFVLAGLRVDVDVAI